MEEKIRKLAKTSLQKIAKAKSIEELENLKIILLGKKSEISHLLKNITKLTQDQRKTMGKIINQAKHEIPQAIERRLKELQEEKVAWIDVTAPGVKPTVGHLHPISTAIREIVSIFEKIGFSRVRYPEVETDFYAFESLNMPKGHPARDEFETFYITDSIVLTPHTSSGQVREMEKGKLPIKILNIAKCYRRQSDVSHTPMFHQFEGLYIDKNVSIANLKGVLDYFIKSFFGPARKWRIRPFHFRFTEPSFEVDVTCGVCEGTTRLRNGQGCRLCKQGWLELGGAGMVHPTVLKNGGIDPNIYSGFAWGWGVERVFMMKEGLKLADIRILYENDIRFLEQF